MMKAVWLVFTVAGLSGVSCSHRAGPGGGMDADGKNPVASLPAGLRAEPGSASDPVSGLPMRAIHIATGQRLVLLPAGAFEMGIEGGAGAERRHRRVIRHAFYLGATEVTVGQFRRFVEQSGHVTDAERGIAEEPDKTVGAFAQTPTLHERVWHADAHWRNPFPRLPGYRVRDDHPVSQVSWNDARAYCEHFGLSLPSEAQWEYGCRGSGGAGIGGGNVADASTKRLFVNGEGGESDDGHPVHAPVDAMEPNGWGLHEMCGNVEEWTSDSWFVSPEDGDDEWARERPGPEAVKALRGGTWFSGPGCDCASRYSMRPFSRRDFIGFRVCVNVAAGK